MRTVIRHTTLAAALLFSASGASAVDLPNLKAPASQGDGSILGRANKSLADQQIKDGQFQFKVGKAEFAPGNDKRIKGLLKVLTDNSKALKVAIPGYHVVAEGHTDADGTPEANTKLSLARAEKVCGELKAKGLAVPCKATGVGSSKPLASPEKTKADKQRNRRVLVQVAK